MIKKEKINIKYEDIFNQRNIDLISEAIENNPREIKRFLNSFILAFEIFHKKKNFNSNELLIIQVIQLRWNSFFNILINSEMIIKNRLLSEINKYTTFDEDKRSQRLDPNEEEILDTKEAFDKKLRKLLSNYRND